MFQSIASCWPLLCWNKTSSVISLSLSGLALSLVLQNVIAVYAGKVLYSSCGGKHGTRYKTNFITIKAVLTFQTLMLATLGKWATTHDRVFYLGQELLLDFSAWINLTLNTDNSLIPVSKQRSKLQNTFCFFKTCWRLTGLSRLYDASQPPSRLQGTLKQCLRY